MPYRKGRQWDFVPGSHEIPAVFTADQCRQIIALHQGSEPMEVKASTGKDSYRNTDVFWLPYDSGKYGWIYERVGEVTERLNDDNYGFELETCTDLQLARYMPGQHYDWHTDLGAGGYSRRKLSTVVMLSPASDYKGGALQFGGDKFTRTQALAQGSAVLFPSWLRHRVTAVTAGERWTLVGWWLGSPFR